MCKCVHVIISIDTCITPYKLTSRPGCLCQAVCFPFVICLCITQAKRLKRFDRCPIHKAAIPNNNNNNGNINTCRQSQRGKGGRAGKATQRATANVLALCQKANNSSNNNVKSKNKNKTQEIAREIKHESKFKRVGGL